VLKRRQLLKGGAAAVLLPVPLRVFSGAESQLETMSETRVIFDIRFPESLAFAEATTRLGADVRGIRGDITDLWYELASPVSGKPRPLAGLTQESDFLLLHQVCMGQGYRLVYHGEHTYHSGLIPRIEHRLQGPAQFMNAVKPLAKSGDNWGMQIADVVSQAGLGRYEGHTFALDSPLVRPRQSPGHLVSWIIKK